ncbi:MAG: hypothetical protein AABX47_05285 [Nanoarchaeota archaeon]
MAGRIRAFIESRLGFALFLLFLVVIFLNRPFQEFPDALSLTVLHAAEMPDQAMVSFVVDADAARIWYPFHWDLKEDAVVGGKKVFSARIYPEQVSALRNADYIVAEGYHGIGNWSRHSFSRAPGSEWNVYVNNLKNEHIDVGIELNGTISATHMLFWTTVGQTEVKVPNSFRGQWIPRNKEMGFRGGYWQYELIEPLNGKISFGVNPPRGILRWIPREELIRMFKHKVESSNIVMADSGKFYVTDVYGSLEAGVDKLLGTYHPSADMTNQ